MDRSDIINLISQSYTTDALGQQIATQTRREVYCNRGSISRNEFFSAGAAGLRPEMVVRMFEPDYQGEELAEIDGKMYRVYRTYRGKNEIIELYLEVQVGER